MYREFQEVLRLTQIVGTDRLIEVQRRVWQAHPALVANARESADPTSAREALWREVLEALRLEVSH